MVIVWSATWPPGASSSRTCRKNVGHHFSPTASNISIEAIAENCSGICAVVLQPDLDLSFEPLALDRAHRPLVLLVRERHAGDPAAGLLGCVDREPAPPAADLEQVVVRARLQQIEQPIPLAHLSSADVLVGAKLWSAEEYAIVSSSHSR